MKIQLLTSYPLPTQMKFAEKLTTLRQQKGMNKSALASALKVQNITITRYERGESLPMVGQLIEIADYFDVTLDYLVGRAER